MPRDRGTISKRSRPALALMVLALSACKTELYTALPEPEANEMVAALEQRGIEADKIAAKDGSDTIMVEKSRFAEAVRILSGLGFPRKTFETMGDVFRSGGLVASPTQERARFLYALGQELSSVVSQIDGVLSARVEVVLPENDILDRSPTPSSASVFVRYETNSGVDRLVPQIKELVSNSVQGLSYDKVSVVLVAVTRPVLPPVSRDQTSDPLMLVLAGLGGGASACVLGVTGYFLRRRLSRRPAPARLGPAVSERLTGVTS